MPNSRTVRNEMLMSKALHVKPPRGPLGSQECFGARRVVGKDAADPPAPGQPCEWLGAGTAGSEGARLGHAYHGLKRKLFCQRGTARLQAHCHHGDLWLSPRNHHLAWPGGRWGLRNRRYFTTGSSVAAVHLPSGPSTVKQWRCSHWAQTAASASRSRPASLEKRCICSDGAGAVEPPWVWPHRHVCPGIAGSRPK